jgi:hypothetical protein
MSLGSLGDYFWGLWGYSLDNPAIGVAIVLAAVAVSYLSLVREASELKVVKDVFSSRIS